MPTQQHMLISPSGFQWLSSTRIGLTGQPLYGSTLTNLVVVREPNPVSNPPAADKASGPCPGTSGTVVAGYNGTGASTWNSLRACEGRHFTITLICDGGNVIDLNMAISAERSFGADAVVARLAADVAAMREMMERNSTPKIYQVVEVRHHERAHSDAPLPSSRIDGTGVFPSHATDGLPNVTERAG